MSEKRKIVVRDEGVIFSGIFTEKDYLRINTLLSCIGKPGSHLVWFDGETEIVDKRTKECACPDCVGAWACCTVCGGERKEAKPAPAHQTRLEILEEFYEACVKAKTWMDCVFTNIVYSALNICDNKMVYGESKEREEIVLTDFLNTVIDNKHLGWMQSAPLNRAALDECARNLAKIEGKEAQDKEPAHTCATCGYWKQSNQECHNIKKAPLSTHLITPRDFSCSLYDPSRRGAVSARVLEWHEGR